MNCKCNYCKHSYVNMLTEDIDCSNIDICIDNNLFEAINEKIEEELALVIKPSHYKAGEFDVIAFCQLHNINFDLGNVIKYVTRAGKKENNSELQDLNKAMEYLKRRVEFIKGE